MAERTIKLHTLMLRGPLSPELLMVTPATAAELLEVAPKYVFHLVKEGHLDRVRIVDRKGRELAVGITEDSIAEFRKSQRRKRQLDLLGDVT